MKSLKDIFKFRKRMPQEITPDDIHEKFRMLMKDVDQLEHRERCITLVKIRTWLTDDIKHELEMWEFSEDQKKLITKHSNENQN